MRKPVSLSAAEAAERLGVKLDTIYAYVSRGLLTRMPGPDKESRFELEQVERLALRGRRSAQPKPEGWVIVTELTEATPDAVRYRGKSALELAANLPFERVAEWLWAVPAESASSFVAPKAGVALARSVQSALPEDAPPLERLRVIASVLGSTDPLRFDTSPGPVVAGARGLIAGLIEALPRTAAKPATKHVDESLAARLYAQLTAARPIAARLHVLDVAMGLCADHALSPSTLAVRIAAAQRADLYGVVQTGLGALSGALHGAASLSAEELIAEVEAGADPAQVIGARLRRGERIPGFGHTLHVRADPRAQALLELLAITFERSRALDAAQQVAEVMAARGLPAPNIDWALAVFVRAAGMLHGASEAIMAVARVAGWIAHALEEYRSPTKFPSQALYVGPIAGGRP
ncbi:MAG TPA: citrate synthase [Polyangiales bacterium]|nr:citrate synthase [Polyangiales bacterium]